MLPARGTPLPLGKAGIPARSPCVYHWYGVSICVRKNSCGADGRARLPDGGKVRSQTYPVKRPNSAWSDLMGSGTPAPDPRRHSRRIIRPDNGPLPQDYRAGGQLAVARRAISTTRTRKISMLQLEPILVRAPYKTGIVSCEGPMAGPWN